ncbi:hypothetical protein FB446DRAFT_534801 [Lentinula raphanica]|nr:hypothetical protein FB446DRAFT_534801 [Lentinula raphanica]
MPSKRVKVRIRRPYTDTSSKRISNQLSGFRTILGLRRVFRSNEWHRIWFKSRNPSNSMDESLLITARFQVDTTVLAQSPISPRKECSLIMYNNICMTRAEFNSTGCYMKWCYTTSSNLCPFTTWHAQVVERLNSVELLSSSMSRIEIAMKSSCSGSTFISESTSHHLLVPHSTTFPVRLMILKMCQKYRQGGGPIEVPVTSFLNFPLTRRHLQTGIAYSTSRPHGITSGNMINLEPHLFCTFRFLIILAAHG